MTAEKTGFCYITQKLDDSSAHQYIHICRRKYSQHVFWSQFGLKFGLYESKSMARIVALPALMWDSYGQHLSVLNFVSNCDSGHAEQKPASGWAGLNLNSLSGRQGCALNLKSPQVLLAVV